jgi:hypothetical protein
VYQFLSETREGVLVRILTLFCRFCKKKKCPVMKKKKNSEPLNASDVRGDEAYVKG